MHKPPSGDHCERGRILSVLPLQLYSGHVFVVFEVQFDVVAAKLVKNLAIGSKHEMVPTVRLPLKTPFMAVGRSPATSKLNLSAAGVNVVASGHIPVDDFENTNVPGVCDTSAHHLFVAANPFVR